VELLPEINSLILKETFSGKTYCFTVCNSRKIYLFVILFVVGVRLDVIVVGVVVVVVVVVIIFLCEKGWFLCGGVYVCVCVCVWFTYLHQNKKDFRKFLNIFNICFLKLRLVSFQLLHYHLLTTIPDKISICNNLQLL